MINKIIEVCLKNRVIIIAACIFVIIWGALSIKTIPIDAIPDIGELQVIVYAEWPGRSPKDIEDQIIYPVTTQLMGTPKVKVVRSSSAFGFGLINLIFKEGTDFYWARTRVLERLNFATNNLPEGASVTLGPDATAVGQIFWYTIEDTKGHHNLAQLRSLQDWYVRYQLTGVEGVSEVASVGGYVKQYQIDVDPNKLHAYGVSLLKVLQAVKNANIDVGAKVFEESGAEYVVRGIGFIKNVDDIEDIVIGEKEGIPIYIKNIAKVTIGPDFRRGALDKEGKEVVGGVVLMRYGENPMHVIKNIKEKIEELQTGLPDGVHIVSFYDRTELIKRSINTLTNALTLEMIITVIVIALFLLHIGSSIVISMVLPIGVLMSISIMQMMNINANIMSLGGIAIAIGVMVGAGIIVIENIYRHISAYQEENNTTQISQEKREEIITKASQEVGRPVFFALLTTIIGFIPVFVLTGQAGKLFHPLAYTKTFAMGGAAILSLMVLPTFAFYIVRGKLQSLDKNKISKILKKIYKPLLEWSLEKKHIIIGIVCAIVIIGIITAGFIKQEFMPPLDEGDLLFMPVLLPGASLTQVMEVMKKQDIIIKNEFPDEVEWVVGKLGRAETATDPAPVVMIETIIHLKDKKVWRKGITREKLIQEIQEKTRIPGVSPIMTQPIRNRIDMLATGIQTPVGIKVFGDDIKKIEEIGIQLESIIREVKGAVSPFAERAGNRLYYEIEINRKRAAKYGIQVGHIQNIIMTAIGGMNITTTVEGRERYPVRVRYLRELRDSPESIKRIFVPTHTGAHIPLAQIATLKKTKGPAMIQAENTLPYARVFINVNQDESGLIDFVKNAQKKVEEKIESGELKLPKGYYLSWSGQFEEEMKSRRRLLPSLGIALCIIIILLYIAFKSFDSLLILATGLPISLIGGILLLFILRFNFSTAVWVGFIALFGIATDNAVVLISTLENIFKKYVPQSVNEIRERVIEGCMLRIRPAIMTTMTTICALIPVMLSSGTGSEILKPMASPTVGGLITATLSNALLVPVIYAWFKERQFKKQLVTENEIRV
ncbi:efflux RND transporter permease subunit [Candidatus Margulisiibacteriota bacterium]